LALNTRSGEQAYNLYLSTFIFGLLYFILIPVSCFLSPGSRFKVQSSRLNVNVSHISHLKSHISTLPVSRNRSFLAKMRTGFTRWFSFFAIPLTAFLLCKPAIADGIIIKKVCIYYSRFIAFHQIFLINHLLDLQI